MGASGQEELVVGQRLAFGELDLPVGGIDPDGHAFQTQIDAGSLVSFAGADRLGFTLQIFRERRALVGQRSFGAEQNNIASKPRSRKAKAARTPHSPAPMMTIRAIRQTSTNTRPFSTLVL